jgi:uncharacterized membrane protein YcaP (DUF421 family)
MTKVVTVLWESAVAFLVLFVISKLLGKRQVAQLQFSDYAVGISIGSIAAQMAFDTEFPFYTYLIAMAVFAVLDLTLAYASRKSKFLKSVLNGKPLVLIDSGKLNYTNLQKSKVDINELIAQARFNGYFDLTHIEYCVFETSGSFSFMPKPDFKEPTVSDLKLTPKESKMLRYIVIDGKIDQEKLKEFNTTQKQLFKKLKITSKKQLKEIAVAFVDGEQIKQIKKH